jgi:hypothetical protein
MLKWVKPGPNTLVHIKRYLGPYQYPVKGRGKAKSTGSDTRLLLP